MVDLSAIRWKPPRITIINKQTNNKSNAPFFRTAPAAVYLCKKAMRPTVAVTVTVKV